MAEGNGGGDPGSQIDGERTEDYQKLITYGLNEKVAAKLDEIYKQGKLRHEVSEHLLSITLYHKFLRKSLTLMLWFIIGHTRRTNVLLVFCIVETCFMDMEGLSWTSHSCLHISSGLLSSPGQHCVRSVRSQFWGGRKRCLFSIAYIYILFFFNILCTQKNYLSIHIHPFS